MQARYRVGPAYSIGEDMQVDDIIAKLTAMPVAAQKEACAHALEATKGMVFIPSPGPQFEAYVSEADVLLFGGSPGGGKTALEVGLALNQHHRTLIVRKNFVDLGGVLHTLDNIVGKEGAATGGNRPVYRKPEGGIIEFMGLGENIDSKQGNPHDLICVDEAAQVPEYQVRMLMGWMRTDIKGQRCRMVLGSNPPLNSTGDWLITYFAPWLDPHHPRPAQEGELRYFLPDPESGEDVERGKDDVVMLHGVKVPAQSRTFISSKFTDNPFYDKEQYAKSLAGLPIEAREILVSGNFLTDRSDDAFQTIPTAWIKEAQARWTPVVPLGVPLCAIGADVAQGGTDRSVLAKRHDGYYARLEVKPGKDTPDGKTYGGWVIANRRNNAKVVIDIGGGWGGDAYAHLRENGVDAVGYMGVKVTMAKTVDNLLGFTNVRSMAYWRFREGLDPSQPGGSRIALPPDPEMVADLCAPTYEVVSSGKKGALIKIESKEDVCDRLKRSTDKGDAVVMAWTDGLKLVNLQGGDWGSGGKRKPQVIMRRR